MEATDSMREISSRSTAITQTEQARQGDIVLYFTDNRKATQQLGWKPQVDLKSGFSRIFEWIRANENELQGTLRSIGLIR